MTIIIDALNNESFTVEMLYNKLRRKFDSTADFVEVLDALFALNKITIQNYTRRIEYVS